MTTTNTMPAVRPLLLALSIVFSSAAVAQEDDADRSRQGGIPATRQMRLRDDSSRFSIVGIGIYYGRALGEYAETQRKGFPGLGIQAALHVKELPIDVGMGFNLDWLDRGTLAVNVGRANGTDTTGELEVETRNYGLLPMIRIRPVQGPFMIYAEVFGGARLYLNRSKLIMDAKDEPISRRIRSPDIALEWGLAAGVMLRAGANKIVEARFTRTWGGQASFVDPDNLQLNDRDQLVFGTRSSSTDAWRLQVGLAQYF